MSTEWSMFSSAAVKCRLLGEGCTPGLGEPSRAGQGWGGTERMLGTEEGATRTGGGPHVPGRGESLRHRSRCQHADIYIRKHLCGGADTHTQTHTSAHTHRGAKPINTLPLQRSYSEQSWNRRAYVDNHTCKLDEQERHLNSGNISWHRLKAGPRTSGLKCISCTTRSA